MLACREGTVGPVDRRVPEPINEILYASQTRASSNEEIYSMNYDGTGIRKRIGASPGSVIQVLGAVWAPDLATFAVVWRYGDQSRQDYPVLWLVDSSGAFIRQIADTANQPLVWSPDGSSLAYACDGLRITNVQSGSSRRIPTGPDTLCDAYDWSKDGSRLLVRVALLDSRRVIQRGELWEMDPDGKLLRRILGVDSIVVTFAQWSPDENQLALIYLRLGDYYTMRATGIWLLQSDGSSIQKLAPELKTWSDRATYGTNDGLRWSPNGQEIGYSVQSVNGGSFSGSKTVIANKNGLVQREYLSDSAATYRICDWR